MFGLFGRQKRERSEGARGSEVAAPAPSQPKLGGRGLDGQAGSVSSFKRQRADESNAAAAAASPLPLPDSKAGADAVPFSCPSFNNPLFAGQDSKDEYEGCDMLSPEWGSAWSTETRESDLATVGAADSASSQELEDFTCSLHGASSGSLLDGFMTALHSTLALCSLTALEKLDMHPVGAEEFSSLEATCAGMLVLCRRAGLTAKECTSDCLVLTLLWLLQSAGSQYAAGLSYNISLLLHLHPDRHTLLKCNETRAAMVQLQLQLLQRCGWRVVLRDPEEVQGALNDLNSHPAFAQLCQFVTDCARTSAVPLGTHGHSPGAAAAAVAQQAMATQQQRSAFSNASVQTCASGSRPAVGSVQGALQPSNRR